jgi:nitronate monooxygenase
MAQGAEAGGHRSTFAFGADDAGPLVGTFALVPLVVDAVDLPVVAAGGVADGRGLAAALALGAQGVALGTRFLLSREAAVAPAYRARLRMLDPADTFVTAAVTGRPARWVRNRVVEELLAAPGTLGWPGQAAAIADVRAAAALAGDEERLPMLAGQAAALASGEEGAEAIVAELVADAEATLRRLAPRP